ncbi:hypothetical protein SpCBS45565_g03751 [Spizellomyces sp. 'palustris']|nr:hypothetical protein SpCBS45565_g03751 [Spizellomyces sp. 'palustris']
MDGIGTTSVWGFSRAVDFQDLNTANGERDAKDVKLTASTDLPPLNVLILGASDARHIIKTVARAWRYGRREMHFWVVESEITVLARCMLLLDVIFGDNEAGLQDRIDTFLEIYGNILLRDQTSAQITETATRYIRLITNSATPTLTPHIHLDLSLLKYRERDDLESVFQFWRNHKWKSFELDKMWDARLRRYYGVRFDSREGVIDWDWNMKLKDHAPTITSHEFLSFRLHGLSFPIRQSIPTHPNRTLATISALPDTQTGTSLPKWGYYSDVVVGPFLGFGLDAEAKKLLKTENGQRKYNARAIAEWNLGGMIQEWKNGRLSEGEATISELQPDSANEASDYISTAATVHLVTVSALSKLQRREGFFNRIYVSSTMAHRINDLGGLLSAESVSQENGTLIVETAKYILDLRPDQAKEYNNRVMKMAVDAGFALQKAEATNGQLDHLVFTKDRKEA